MIIYPEILVTPDTPTIKFSQPREQVDLAKELPRILHVQGWGVGTFFNVMFMNHEKTKLLACGRFVVTEEVETIKTSDEDPYKPMTKTVFSRQAEQIGNWWPEAPLVVPVDLRDNRLDNVNFTSASDFKSEPTEEDKLDIAVIHEQKRRGRPPKAA